VAVLTGSHGTAHLDPTGFLGRVLHPFRAQALALGAPAASLGRLPAAPMSSHFCYEYFRRHGNRLVVGGMRWSVPGEEVGITDTATINEDIHRNLRAWIDRHIPSVAGIAPDRAWSGILCGTPDGLPVAGMIPGRGGLFALAGFNGYGLSLAVALAAMVAEQIQAGRSRREWSTLFRPGRFA
jgi:glycine/D-amino acid oxidase-like deaminating enzyme